MDDKVRAGLQRWLEAEAAARDDEADDAFGSVFRAVGDEQPASAAFAASTMQAIAAEAARDAVRVARTRRVALVLATVAVAVGAYFGAGYAVSAAGAMFVGLFNLLVGLVVRVAAGVHAGADIWSLLSSLGHAASALVADPKVTFVLLLLQGLALAALVALQRLLGSDGESWK